MGLPGRVWWGCCAAGALLFAACGAKSALETNVMDAATPRDIGPDAPPLATFPCRWTAQPPIELMTVREGVTSLVGAVHTHRDEVLVQATSPGFIGHVATISLGVDGLARLDRVFGPVAAVTDIVPTRDEWAVFDGSEGCRLVRLDAETLAPIGESELDGVERCRVDVAQEDGGVLLGAAGLETRVERLVRDTGREPLGRLLDVDLVSEPTRPVVGSGGGVFAAWPMSRRRGVAALVITDRGLFTRALVDVQGTEGPISMAPEPLRGGAVFLGTSSLGLTLFALRDASLEAQALTTLAPTTEPIDPRLSTNETEALFAVRGGDVMAVPLNGAAERRVDAPPIRARLATVILRRGTSFGGELFTTMGESGEVHVLWRNLVCNR